MRRNWTRILMVLLAVLLATPMVALAQEDPAQPDQGTAKQEQPAAKLAVAQAVIARDVTAREPVDPGTSFARDVGELICFSKITGASGETSIVHVWKHGDTEMARVELPVKSASWRTWSRKKILPEWTGAWTVEIQDTNGNVLDTQSFSIEDSGKGPEEGEHDTGKPGGTTNG
ncbi:MAG TPA: DUF2914 domain-containing protein [Candidatus Saccharimonadales bacterium]|nr:DUF2914 domain-containing protein [Candidatus Saccharimonadales bacterium]